MFSKSEAANIRREFWIAFDTFSRKYLGPQKKWIRYDTGIKDLCLKFEVNKKYARVLLAIENNNENTRFDRFLFLKNYELVINRFIETDWIWDEQLILENGKEICAIYKQLNDVNIYKKDDWNKIFDFLAKEMFALEKAFFEIKPLLQEYINNNKL